MESEVDTVWAMAGLAVALAGLILIQGVSFNRRMDRRMDLMTQRMDQMQKQMNRRMDQMDKRMNLMDQRMNLIQQQQVTMLQQIGDIRERLAGLEVLVEIIRSGLQLPRMDELPDLSAKGHSG